MGQHAVVLGVMSGRPRNPEARSPGNWTRAETEQIRFYGAHVAWLQHRLWALSERVNDEAAFTGPVDIPVLRDVLRRFGELNQAYDRTREVYAMLALKRARLTERESARLLGIGKGTISRWSVAFNDPDDFDPSRLTASLRLNDNELGQLVAYWYHWSIVDGWDSDPETGSVILGNDFILVPPNEPAPEPGEPWRSLDYTTVVARAMRSLGWIYQYNEETSSITWTDLPNAADEAEAAIRRHLAKSGDTSPRS